MNVLNSTGNKDTIDAQFDRVGGPVETRLCVISFWLRIDMTIGERNHAGSVTKRFVRHIHLSRKVAASA